MSVRDQVKETLGVIEPLRRKLSEADQTWHEIDVIGGVLTGKKNELAEVETWLERTKVAAQEATTKLDQLNQASAQEEKRLTARIDPLKRELIELEKQVAAKRLELDSAVAGIAALHRRLTVGT